MLTNEILEGWTEKARAISNQTCFYNTYDAREQSDRVLLLITELNEMQATLADAAKLLYDSHPEFREALGAQFARHGNAADGLYGGRDK